MDARLREIIDLMPCCRETIREASRYLPEDEELLDSWIGETVSNLDSLAFGYLVVGAVHRGLPVRSRHLEHGLKFLPGFQTAGCLILRVTGDDVPERVERALRLGGIEASSHAPILIATWHWCADRGIPFPTDLMNAARGYAHRFRSTPNCRGMFLHLAMLADDRRIKHMITGGDLPDEARETLESKTEKINAEVQSLYRGDILNTVAEKPEPDKKPKTVRRAVEHIGRNDPCPCGSGKKHKRCCFEKTRERLLHSSDVEGLTMGELDSELEAHMTLERLSSLNNAKLMRLDPLKLDPALISPLIDRLSLWKLFDEATAVMEKVAAADESDELPAELQDQWLHLVMHASQARRKNVLRRLVALHAKSEGQDEDKFLPVSARLLLAEGDAERTLAIIEETSRMLAEDIHNGSLFFHGMSFVIAPLGALGVMLSQAVIARLDIKDALALLELLATRRAELDLPIDDPMTAVIEKRIAAEGRKEENKDSAKLAAAMRKMDALAEKERKASAAARQMEKELARLTKKAAERKEAAPDAPPHDDSEIKALREKLRIHEANERINAEERAAHRRATSELLLLEEKLREKERNPKKPEPHREDDTEEAHLLKGELEGAQPLRLIAFPGKFLESLRPFPKHVGKQALALLGRIAAGEPAAFHDVLRLRACDDVFRARIGIDHRLLFRLHPEELEVIALIDRRDLDSRIKTLRKHG